MEGKGGNDNYQHCLLYLQCLLKCSTSGPQLCENACCALEQTLLLHNTS